MKFLAPEAPVAPPRNSILEEPVTLLAVGPKVNLPVTCALPNTSKSDFIPVALIVDGAPRMPTLPVVLSIKRAASVLPPVSSVEKIIFLFLAHV